MKVPNSRRNLDEAIKRLAASREDDPLRLRGVLANTIVAQMLPDGVVKGGSAIKLRLGDSGTRFTTDLDVARAESLQNFTKDLQKKLEDGWEGFTGRPVIGTPAQPKNVPAQYVMQPFEVKLSYLGKPWYTVKLEVGHNEIGDADSADFCLSDDVAELFESLGFPKPHPIPLMKLHYQVAQKLHALTEPGSRRAHDLIDLQLLMMDDELDYVLTNITCKRLFDYRSMQPWPTIVVANDAWEPEYQSQSEGLANIMSLDRAIEWANELIRQIASA